MFRIDTFCGKRVLPATFVTSLLSHTQIYMHLRRRVGILRYRHTLEKKTFLKNNLFLRCDPKNGQSMFRNFV